MTWLLVGLVVVAFVVWAAVVWSDSMRLVDRAREADVFDAELRDADEGDGV